MHPGAMIALVFAWAAFSATENAGQTGSAGQPMPGSYDPREPATVCELGRADRARTPARRCQSCHDGVVASNIEFMPSMGEGHPVDVDYYQAQAREPELYAAAPPREMPLIRGRIACTTCHDGASPGRFHVAQLSGAQNLCVACHQK